MAKKEKPDSTPRAVKAAAAPPAAAAEKSPTERMREAPPGSPPIRRVRLIALGLLILVLVLVFAVPRRPEPPPSLDQPAQAFVDRVGLVSPDYARTMAGVLLDEPRYQLVVHVDARPPAGSLAAWASQTATDWKVGALADNGIALFVFRDARIARAEVGYGLEGPLPDALVRRLLEDRLAPHFTRGDYEAGFDAFNKGIGEALGGDAALHALWLELGGRPRKSTVAMLLDTFYEGIERAPRMLQAAWRRYIEGDATDRVFVLVCSGIFLAILAATGVIGAVTASQVVKMARRGRGGGAGARPGPAAATGPVTVGIAGELFFVVFGAFVFCLFSMILLFALSLAGDALHRKGEFSGAGAWVSWPAAR